MTERPDVEPGEIIAALADDLHYSPRRSVVLLLMGTNRTPDRGREVHTTITLVVHEDGLGDELPPGTLLGSPNAALAIIVDDRLAPATHTGPGRPRSSMQQQFDNDLLPRLSAAGIDVLELWATPALSSGSEWWDLRAPARGGRLKDPAPVPGSLAEQATRLGLEPTRAGAATGLDHDPDLTEQVMAALTDLVSPDQVPSFDGEDLDGDRAAVHEVLQTVQALATRHQPSPEQLARTAVAVTRTLVAAAVLDLPADYREAAERLWIVVTRSVRGPYRAVPAALLAMSAHRRGDGILAGAAHRIAFHANPADLMAALLGGTFDKALPPQTVERIVTALAARATRSLGIDLTTLLTPQPPTTA